MLYVYIPVGVGVNGLGHVVVDDEADVLDVDASARHVGGHEDVLGALLEPGERVLPLLLTLASVKSRGIVSHLLQTCKTDILSFEKFHEF